MKACDINCNCTIFHKDILDKVKNDLHPEDDFDQLVSLFKILNDKSRLKILEAIKDESLCVCDLAHLLGISKSAISHQMKPLKSANLVESTKKGKMVYYHLKDQNIRYLIEHGYRHTKGKTYDQKND
ncbi:MAG: metalloregulator ArsR/SmtB family transcription factor [Acholeplasmataceae bacterium]|jgi:DNA-binding transcriptional ArsR family regulator|nr:metalloregulator ArsR/SmtB family transcription factor [Acholeplasmataceae bacterium]